MAESNSKQRKALEEEDRISNLPDDVLNHILSCLLTKTAVTTGCLSHRWRHLWQHLRVLDFYDDSLYSDNPIELKKFVFLVTEVLTLLRNPRGIRKMRLHCAHSVINDDNFHDHSLDTWVCPVIGPYLEELDLDLYIDDENAPDFKLPLSLFTCPNLVSLSICGGIHLDVQSTTPISLPSLKMLLIDVLGNVEVAFVNALLYGCPNIDALDLHFLSDSLENVCLPASLKRLKIQIDNDFGSSLEINAPDLEYLNIYQHKFIDVLSMNSFQNVVEASLDLFPFSYNFVDPLLKLLNTLSRTKHLVLSGSTTKWLLGEPRDLFFQEFRYLLHLELILPWFNSNSLLSLFQKCPVLQVLKIQNKERSPPILGWAPQPNAPKCIVSHLTFIQFKGFLGLPDEVSFVEHVLQEGLVLKTIMIISDISLDQSKKYDILKRLSNVPRASRMCQLTFDCI